MIDSQFYVFVKRPLSFTKSLDFSVPVFTNPVLPIPDCAFED